MSQIPTGQVLQCKIDKCTAFYSMYISVKVSMPMLTCSSTQFPPEHYINMDAQVLSLAHHKLDILLLGTTIENHEEISVYDRHKPVRRQWITSLYIREGYHVCTKMYAFLYVTGENHILQRHHRE